MKGPNSTVDDFHRIKDPIDPIVAQPEPTCDVCGKSPIGVACSSTGAVSFAYCEECLRNGREPYGALVASVVGMKSMDDVAEWYKPIIRSNLRMHDKTEEEFFKEAVAFGKEYEEAVRASQERDQGDLPAQTY